jgi:hypothetical protein
MRRASDRPGCGTWTGLTGQRAIRGTAVPARHMRDRPYRARALDRQDRGQHRDQAADPDVRVRDMAHAERLLPRRRPERAVAPGDRRIGARYKGILRTDRLSADGLPRDSARFVATAADWPAVRAHLAELSRERVLAD